MTTRDSIPAGDQEILPTTSLQPAGEPAGIPEPRRSYEYVEAWGMARGSYARVLRPRSVEGIQAVLERARGDGVPLGLRGTGNSYGDASLNERGHVLDIRDMNRILAFDAETGVVEAQAGVTIRQLWRTILPQGYWPRVVSGTMFPTLAGVAAMNIHGKNNYAVGTVGDAIREFDIVLPNGELKTCSRTANRDLFHAAIGGFGMLGVFSRFVLETKRVHSGELEVKAYANHDLREAMDYIEAHKGRSDYLVGWIDCFAGEDQLGRGTLHDARYLEPGEDPDPERTLQVAHQELPPSILGFPKAEVWRILRLFNTNPGMRFVNAVKYLLGRREALGPPHRWTHAEFAFMLDYVPNWKWSYGRRPGWGLIQHQLFVPHRHAHEVFCEVLRRSQRVGHVPYLGVLKRHRPDPFWLTHAVDGWSFALDFKVTPRNRASLWDHCRELTELVLEAGGKFYFAKDLVLDAASAQRMYDPDRLAAFRALKKELDPSGVLETDLWRRLFQRIEA